jgi:predicted nucleotidyltransferase component of viral defense system
MTANVRKVLDKICHDPLFSEALYFTGGTALAYYLDHRVSEDIDIISHGTLPYKKIIPHMKALGGQQIEDENTTALRISGLFPNEYMIKFVLNNVKLEFFQANRALQKEILSQASLTSFENSNLKILDLKSIAKLKLLALVMRNKSRDLFDFGAILEYQIFSSDELTDLFSVFDRGIASYHDIIGFVKAKKEPQDDEAVYLSESERMDLSFEEIKERVINFL